MSRVRLVVDAREVGAWARRIAGARGVVREELAVMTEVLAEHGAETAQQLVRVDTGRLRDSIVAETASAGDVATGSWAPATEYAVIHEFGGVIRPKRGRYLRFRGRDGRTVFARRVVITAQPYMRPSAESVGRRLSAAAVGAARRIMARLAR